MFEALGGIARGTFHARGASRARGPYSRGVSGRLERVDEEAEGGEEEAEEASARSASDAERARSRRRAAGEAV